MSNESFHQWGCVRLTDQMLTVVHKIQSLECAPFLKPQLLEAVCSQQVELLAML